MMHDELILQEPSLRMDHGQVLTQGFEFQTGIRAFGIIGACSRHPSIMRRTGDNGLDG